MERQVREELNSIMYTYVDTKLSKEEMLGYIIDILNDDDIVSNGLILIAPANNEASWPGQVTELPTAPERDVFVETYKDAALSGVTAVMQYHDQPMMITYRPESGSLSVILPREFHDTIDDVEKNVIPDAIDEHPAD